MADLENAKDARFFGDFDNSGEIINKITGDMQINTTSEVLGTIKNFGTLKILRDVAKDSSLTGTFRNDGNVNFENINFDGNIQGAGTVTLGRDSKATLDAFSFQNEIVLTQQSHLHLNNDWGGNSGATFQGAVTIAGPNSVLTTTGMWGMVGNISFDAALNASASDPWLTINNVEGLSLSALRVNASSRASRHDNAIL